MAQRQRLGAIMMYFLSRSDLFSLLMSTGAFPEPAALPYYTDKWSEWLLTRINSCFPLPLLLRFKPGESESADKDRDLPLVLKTL